MSAQTVILILDVTVNVLYVILFLLIPVQIRLIYVIQSDRVPSIFRIIITHILLSHIWTNVSGVINYILQ
ncbi:hypothetical protein PFISCL1PPCAC_4295, partial [Pristionchus fissidentatus]